MQKVILLEQLVFFEFNFLRIAIEVRKHSRFNWVSSMTLFSKFKIFISMSLIFFWKAGNEILNVLKIICILKIKA